MALNITGLPRVFQFKKGGEKISLDDPNVGSTPEQVMNLYSNNYPELTTATLSGPKIKDGKAIYKFETVVGNKG